VEVKRGKIEIQTIMLAYTYIEKGRFALVEKPKPVLIEATDILVFNVL
jgi:hypothetical protein